MNLHAEAASELRATVTTLDEVFVNSSGLRWDYSDYLKVNLNADCCLIRALESELDVKQVPLAHSCPCLTFRLRS